MAPPKRNIIERFWEKVNIKGFNECWEWMAGRHWDGYGGFWISGKSFKAHRVSWMLQFGKIPKNKFVLHTCDNKSCVNPKHLWLGTHRDNMDDMVRKNRQAKGKDNKSTKLTMVQVREIRNRYIPYKCSGRKLAREYGVAPSRIWNIVNRRSWAWLD